ncbi:replication initiator protein A [Bacillus thuringiensis]|nr:replication initiator protein A [Bacillus thuringiensis]MEC3071911.1 replication initiator protein A [Bacillus cereus]MEC3096976.1 replication initiator protein A [Bacillus cereus]MEC3453471.1 replication initiator protein A [Bacillus thuringiensis]MEC3508972.1 replication initiator protein A [Bacillus thuringiensis]MED2047889.1 replication initiator protein A [Bacillus thuringiensis]
MMPKAVEEYLTIHDVSLGACKLYMHLRDRYRLSLKSVSEGNDKYEDELGVFCIFPIEDLVEIMGKNEKTVRRWYKELKECDLIQYRQVKKESGQANRFYIKEEQLVDSGLIALYKSEEYKPVVHYPQIGAVKNVRSTSGQKCPPINNSYLINNKIYSEFLSNSHEFLTTEEAEKIVRKFKGDLDQEPEDNKHFLKFANACYERLCNHDVDPHETWKEHNEKQGAGYVGNQDIPEDTYNQFVDALNDNEGKSITDSKKSHIEGNKKPYLIVNNVPKLTGKQFDKLIVLVRGANSGDPVAWKKCESPEMQSYVEKTDNRFKIRNAVIRGM